jgi:hypothetical protein
VIGRGGAGVVVVVAAAVVVSVIQSGRCGGVSGFGRNTALGSFAGCLRR